LTESIVVGLVTGVFGVRGDVKIEVGAFDLQPGLEVEVQGPAFERRTLRISQVRRSRKYVRARFEGVENATVAERLRGATIRAARSALAELPANTYLESELVGMEVIDRNLGALGRVSGIQHYPGSDMLVVGAKRVLVPMLIAFGVRVDRKKRTISTELPAGFEELL